MFKPPDERGPLSWAAARATLREALWRAAAALAVVLAVLLLYVAATSAD